jgi:amino acid adenylation domain-containing protein
MQTNDALIKRLAGLPPAKKEALKRLLREKVVRGQDLKPRVPGERVPLAYGQRRLWLLDQLSPENPAYNETNSLRFRVPLNLEVFRRAVNEIVRRHESLRTSVQVIDGVPVQSIAQLLSINIPLADLRHMSPADREAEALKSAVEQSRVAFDLSEGPLLRGSVYRLDTADFLFVLTMHHMICDGWSMGVFMVELVALYWSFLAGKPSPLPELQIQLGDYAVWQHRNLSPNSQNQQLTYWREQLRDLPILQLPTDRPRPAEFTYRGARQPVKIAGDAYASLTRLAERQNVTLFTVLFAVFGVLLHRYTEQEDIPIGAPSAGRSRKELEPLIGFLVNTFVMRLQIPGNATFLEVLENVRRTTIEAYANQDVPFDRLVEELQPKRDKSRNPLFQVMFQLFTRPSAPGLKKDLLLPFLPVDSGSSKFDLSAELIWTEDAIQGQIEYNTDLFDAGRIERMVAHFYRLIESVTADPTRRISDLAILTPEEENQLVVEWNNTSVPYPRDQTIPGVFLEQMARTPDAPAVRFEGQTLSYRELHQRAESVAAELNSRGIRPGNLVGLHLERSLELPAALLGILMAGAAYVPLDPGYPRERIAYLVADSGVRGILTTTNKAADLAGFEGAVITMDDLTGSPPDVAGSTATPSATDVAYVMYTSGTTGDPKGVAVTHRNILRLVKNVRYVNFDANQTVLQFAPISFDASTFEVWGCLLNGGTLAIHPPGVPSLEELGAFIKAEKISLLFLTTSLFGQMIEHCAADLRGVEQIVTGGEQLFVSVAKAAWKALPRSRIVNGYGPTECTTFACTYTVARPEALGHTVPIGRPIENTTAYILDHCGNLMPIGMPGELYIGGDGVAARYCQRPELTEERFVRDPFVPDGRLYRTGDVACYREDGNILFLGRRDRQVKLSGYRIELSEVESTIVSHPNVCGAAVVLTGTEQKRLRAFYETHGGRTLSPAALRSYLSQQLPPYMVPSQLEAVDQLPLTPNGKVDFDALSCRELRDAGQRETFVPAKNPTEQRLREIWSELLQAERVGVRDNFFELGGHSLLATRLLSRIRNAFEVQITMQEFFDRPTIEDLAELLNQRAGPIRQSTFASSEASA